MNVRELLRPELAWTGERFERDVVLAIGEDGRFVQPPGDGEPSIDVRPLPRVALLPGFASAHSRAPLRGLRGHSERFPDGFEDSSRWRETQQRFAADEEALELHCRRAFDEMLAAGITAVGELVEPGGRGGPGAAAPLLRAAAASGIRLVLLPACTTAPSAYWKGWDGLAGHLDGPLQSLGAAVPDVNALEPKALRELHAEALGRDLVFHLRLEASRAEVEACFARHGVRPAALLREQAELGPHLTALHCTHVEPEDLAALAEAGATVCACPSSEAAAGSAIPDVVGTLGAGGRVAVGTGANARISLVEELRWLEYVQRLAHEGRGVCVDERGALASVLLGCATVAGARSLGIDAGALSPGRVADLVALDLDAPSLRGSSDETLAESLVFGAGNGAIVGAMVDGRWRIGGSP